MAGMRCLSCGNNTDVEDSRPTVTNVIRRRRKCSYCAMKFNTYEIPYEMYQRLREDPSDSVIRAVARAHRELSEVLRKTRKELKNGQDDSQTSQNKVRAAERRS